jgi:hypothetical protein
LLPARCISHTVMDRLRVISSEFQHARTLNVQASLERQFDT